MQFDGFIDLDAYDTIALKLKGDGRSYISTVSFLSHYYSELDGRNWLLSLLWPAYVIFIIEILN